MTHPLLQNPHTDIAIAITGPRGAGKTYLAKKIMELLVDANISTVRLDNDSSGTQLCDSFIRSTRRPERFPITVPQVVIIDDNMANKVNAEEHTPDVDMGSRSTTGPGTDIDTRHYALDMAVRSRTENQSWKDVLIAAKEYQDFLRG